MPLFQIQYKKNTKTYNIDLEFKTLTNLLTFFDELIGVEVTEVREYKYLNKNVIVLDDGNYNHRYKFKVYGDQSSFNYVNSFAIPKIKKLKSVQQVLELLKPILLCQNKKPSQILFTDH